MSELVGKQKLIVGLGNPGDAYEKTRHNIGFLVVKAFANKIGISWRPESRFCSEVAKGVVNGVGVHILLPLTYMNRSGLAVKRYFDYFKFTPEELIVVSDEIHLEFGEIRLKAFGSAGGHNGLKSIEQEIGTRDYARLRIGIGKEEHLEGLAGYVLDRFSTTEQNELPQVIEAAADALYQIVCEDISRVMNRVNTKQNSRCSNKLDRPEKGSGEKT